MQSKALQYFSELHDLIDSSIRDSSFPGVVFLVKRRDEWILHHAMGRLRPDLGMMNEDVIFDVASLTKVLATAPAVMLLHQTGLMSIDDRVVKHIPAFIGGEKALVTVADLLAHSSGLPAWAPLYLYGESPDEMFDFLCRLPLRYSPGERVEYSCLGYILLGKIVEAVSGQEFSAFVTEHILEPLELRRTFFNPPEHLLSHIAPTEDGNGHELRMATQFLDDFSAVAAHDDELKPYQQRAERRLGEVRREGVIHGEVHDCNSYFMGGATGNAGLFSCASDLVRFSEEFLGGLTGRAKPRILAPESIRQMTECHRASDDQRWGLGWQLVTEKTTSAGSIMPRSAFGHTAFTGCSLWVDPLREQVIALLSNAVHPKYNPDAMRRFRPAFHDLVVKFSDCIAPLVHA